MLQYISTEPPEDGGLTRNYFHCARRGVARISLSWFKDDGENVVCISSQSKQRLDAAMASFARMTHSDIKDALRAVKERDQGA